ncbi:MAG: HAMP domain-containing sensor histidine kinase [Xanthomonadaceae bacterium]|nr:HAMP domain-containing sensor histidine kinase [Xanthomonadaceae bacterium]
MTADRRDIPYSQRLQEGEVVAVWPPRVRLRLIDCPWAEYAIVPAGHFHAGKNADAYTTGQRHRVFLLNPHERQPDARYASLRWVEHNPWTQPPRVGDLLPVQVDNMPTGEAAYAIAEHSGIEIRIDRRDLPGSPSKVQELLDKGDRLEVCITEVQREHLHIAGSVKQAMALANQRNREAQRRVLHAGVIETIDREAWAAAHRWPGAERSAVALCLHDEYFAEHLLRWLSSVGFEVFACKQAGSLLNLLEAADRPDHVLLSSAAWPRDRATEQALRKRLSDPALRLTWLAAPGHPVPTLGSNPAVHDGSPAAAVLHSPFELVELLRTLSAEPGQMIGSLPADEANSEPASLLPAAEHTQLPATAAAPESTDAARAAQFHVHAYLQELCTACQLTAALWVRQETTSRYRPIAWHGIEPARLEAARLDRSPLADVFLKGEAVEVHHLNDSGELADLAPSATERLCILPLGWRRVGEAEVQEALVLFHARQDRSQGAPPSPRHFLPGLRLAAEALRLAAAQADLTAFAQIGLNWSAYLHETREAAESLAEKIDQLAEHSRSGAVVGPEQWRVLSKNAWHLRGIADAELDLVRKRQKVRVSVRATVERVAELLLHKFDIADCALSVQVPDLPLSIALPPVVLEQSLRNLLDNALHFAGLRRAPVAPGAPGAPGAAVAVTVSLAGAKAAGGPASALYLDVADNGPGVRADWVAQVFTPRDTGKDERGSGLGLHYCRTLLREAGGDLLLTENRRWRRTVFRIALPIRLAGQ